MIRNIYSSSPYLITTQTSDPYIETGSSLTPPYTGALKFDSNNGMQVYNGSYWLPISSAANVDLTPIANEAIEWATRKKAEEKQLDELCEKYPALKIARDNFELIKQLVQDDAN